MERAIRYTPNTARPKLMPTTNMSNGHTSTTLYHLEVAISALKIESGSASTAMPVRITESAVRFSESSSCTWLMLRMSFCCSEGILALGCGLGVKAT